MKRKLQDQLKGLVNFMKSISNAVVIALPERKLLYKPQHKNNIYLKKFDLKPNYIKNFHKIFYKPVIEKRSVIKVKTITKLQSSTIA